MFNKQLFLQTLTDAAEENALDVTSYSGRGMFGRSCVSIRCTPGEFNAVLTTAQQTLLSSVFETAFDCPDDEESLRKAQEVLSDSIAVCSRLNHYEEDQMGYDRVFYWPTINAEDGQ